MTDQVNRTIQRSFEVLDYLSAANRPVRLKEIVASLGYPTSSASDVLKSLVMLGYLNFDRDIMSYTLTPRITTLGTGLNDALWQDERIMLGLQRLAGLTGGTVGLGVQSDIYAQYITVIHSVKQPTYELRPGAIRPVTRSGIGWALLSQRDDEEIERLRRRVNAKQQDRALHVGAAALAAQIAGVRRTGYAFSRNTFHPGIGIIAMPLPRPVGGRWCAMGAAGTVEDLDRDEQAITAELREIVSGWQDSSDEKFAMAKIEGDPLNP